MVVDIGVFRVSLDDFIEKSDGLVAVALISVSAMFDIFGAGQAFHGLVEVS